MHMLCSVACVMPVHVEYLFAMSVVLLNEALQNSDRNFPTSSYKARWLQVAPKIKDAMQQAGDAMIGFQPLQGLPNFFRIVFPSACTVSTKDLDALMTRIEAFGNKLFPALQH